MQQKAVTALLSVDVLPSKGAVWEELHEDLSRPVLHGR